MSQERLHKFLARAGIASRRASERLIRDGHIKVNGKIVREMGVQIDPVNDRVEFDGHQITADDRNVYLLLNKPAGTISAAADPEGRQTVTELVPEDFGRLYPVGRLDWDSEGALLLTNDGELTNLLTHPRHEVTKTYFVKVRGQVGETDVRIERLRDGVTLDDGYKTQPAEVVRDSDTGNHTWFVVGIREGKNRQIRRMFESQGMTVLKLRRIAYGPVVLGDLPPAMHRKLTESEIEELYEAAGGKRPVLSATRGRMAAKHRDGKAQARKTAKRLAGPRRIRRDEDGPGAEPQREQRTDGRRPEARKGARGGGAGSNRGKRGAASLPGRGSRKPGPSVGASGPAKANDRRAKRSTRKKK